MSKKDKRWSLRQRPNPDDVLKLAKEIDRSYLFAAMCLQRELHTATEIENYITPNVDNFHSPFDIHDMEKAVTRIQEAIISEEKITVYGDYDADGITSTSIIVEALESLGAHVDYYIPNRFTEGYGPNVEAFKQLIEKGTQLIITVDNGVQGHQSIDFAKSEAVDVIVTDHHELPETLPDAYAIIHPQHPEGNYPFGDLAGAGVALKLVHALLEELPYELMELAAIGTVADLVSLTDENRLIVQIGLKLMAQTQRFGLLALLETCDVSPDKVDETTIGFRIGPRLNAAGRMADASLGVQLLTTQDPDEAQYITDQLEQLNVDRKSLVSNISEMALEKAEEYDDDAVLIIDGREWHVGVIGIVASRVVEKTGKPTIILSRDENNTFATGSGRSIASFNLFEALNVTTELFESFGGHHMAAGLTLSVEKIDDLREHMNAYAREHYSPEDLIAELEIDAPLTLEQATIEAVTELDKFSPFGTDNQRPKFILKDVTAIGLRKIGADLTHMKCEIAQGSKKIGGIGFNLGERVDQMSIDPKVDVVGQLEINEWNGNRTVQLNIEDLQPKEIQVIDYRSRHFPKDIFGKEEAAYIFYNKKTYQKLSDYYPDADNFYYVADEQHAKDLQLSESILGMVDCPPSLSLIQPILQNHSVSHVLAAFYSYENVYFQGLASREDFVKVYKYFVSHQNINYGAKRQELAKFLGFDINLLNHIIFVFIEVGYVTIENGVIRLNNNPPKLNLTETETYKHREQMMQMEEILLFSSIKNLTKVINEWSQTEEKDGFN